MILLYAILVYQGEKLRLQSQIITHSIKPDEFLVLVPFIKKVANNQSQKCDQSKTSLTTSAHGSMSKFANSAWSDMMQDLSYLRDNSSSGTPSVSNIGSFSVGGRIEVMENSSCSREAKRKRGFGCDDIILDMLWASRSKNVLDEQNSRRFVELSESVNCLSDPYSGDCMLWRRKASGIGLHHGNGNSCLCPEWLKKIMKAFAFLNTFSALVQLQQERTTSCILEQALEQLATFGVKLGMQDMEHLSVISPTVIYSMQVYGNKQFYCVKYNHCLGFLVIQVVLFVKENAEETSYGNALVIIECSTEQNHRDKNNHESGIVEDLKLFCPFQS